MKLTPYERWMVQSNLTTIQQGTPADEQVALLRRNGYNRVAEAVILKLKELKK